MNQPLDTAHPRHEAVGPSYSIAGMQHAATQTMLAVQQIAAQLRPGMSAAQAQDIANATMQAMGAERTWHPHLVRIGSDTQKIYSEQDDTSLVLGEEDIFFIDLGLVFNGQVPLLRWAKTPKCKPAPKPPKRSGSTQRNTGCKAQATVSPMAARAMMQQGAQAQSCMPTPQSKPHAWAMCSTPPSKATAYQTTPTPPTKPCAWPTTQA